MGSARKFNAIIIAAAIKMRTSMIVCFFVTV